MYENLSIVNSAGGIMASIQGEIPEREIYLAPGTDDHTRAENGEFGAIAPLVTVQEIATEEMVREECSKRLLALVSTYHGTERETWGQQVKEAEAHLANPSAVTPLLSAMSAGNGGTVEQWRDRILANALLYSQAAGIVLGKQDALLQMDPIPSDYDNDSYWTVGS